ncbi:MAG: SLC13 family permease [Gammaproteobacteria bacterium]
MLFDAWLTLVVIGFCFSSLVFTRYSPDIIMMGAVTVLFLNGVLTTEEALGGFANEGMITVAVLYIVASGLQETGTIKWLCGSLLGRPKTVPKAQFRLMTPVAIMSAFLNNTPVVAMFIPMVSTWARNNNIHVSQLMIPLSYAAIIGGASTLIGSSTNLIVNSMLIKHSPQLGLSMFDLAWIGVPCMLAIIGFIVLFGHKLLPKHGSAGQDLKDVRQYTVEMRVAPDSVIDGKTIDQAGLRNLAGLFLISIERKGETIPSVGPHRILKGDDRLLFVGDVESVVDLKKFRGLDLIDKEDRHFLDQTNIRSLVEVVVSENCPLIGSTIRDSRFRTHYNAAIVAVARNGNHLKQKIGNIVLKPGDTLLLDARENFLEQQRFSKDFLLTSQVKDSRAVRHNLSIVALAILATLVLTVSMQWMSMLQASMLAAGMMLLTKCTTSIVARKSIDYQVLIVIAASIALGVAVEKTGLATLAADKLIGFSGSEPLIAMAMLFIVTALFTSILSNTAAAVVLFPIAIATAESLNVQPMPFVITLMIAATASFATPISYQTNLMVYGPGGYRFTDYMRIGLPLTVIVFLITLIIVPNVWPF